MPDTASLPKCNSSENLLELLLDYAGKEINENSNIDDINRKHEKPPNEAYSSDGDNNNHTEVNSCYEVSNNPGKDLNRASSSKRDDAQRSEKHSADLIHAHVSDSGVTIQRMHDSTTCQLPAANSCYASEEISNHTALIDFQKLGAKRVEDLFSREQFCSMTSIFDELLQQVKDQLNRNYGRVREEMQFAAKQVVSTEMNRILLTAQQLRDQVVSLRSLVQNQERMIARKDQVIDDLMADLKRVNQNAEKNRERFHLEKEEFCCKIVDQYARKRLLIQVFTAWKSSLERTWKARVMKRLQEEARVECERLISEHNSRTQQLEHELRVTRSELEATRVTKAEENEALKMALMRGVCALNMETMSLFNKDVRPQSGEPASADNLNQNAHNWSTADVIQCYQDTLTNRLGSRVVPNGTPTPRRFDASTNGNPPGLPEPNFHHVQEAWPRQMPVNCIVPRSSEQNFSNAFTITQQNPNDFCARWLNQTQLNSTHVKPISDRSSFRPVAQLQTNSVSQFRVPDGVSPNSMEADCFTPLSKTEDCQVMELPITTTLKPETQAPLSSSFSNTNGSRSTTNGKVNTQLDSEGARKQLNSRTLSAQKTLSNLNPNTRWSSLPKAHTVQLGVPTGPSSHSSCVTASVQVLRHQPVSQATLTCQMNSSTRHKDGDYSLPFQTHLSVNKRGANATSSSAHYPLASSIYHG